MPNSSSKTYLTQFSPLDCGSGYGLADILSPLCRFSLEVLSAQATAQSLPQILQVRVSALLDFTTFSLPSSVIKSHVAWPPIESLISCNTNMHPISPTSSPDSIINGSHSSPYHPLLAMEDFPPTPQNNPNSPDTAAHEFALSCLEPLSFDRSPPPASTRDFIDCLKSHACSSSFHLHRSYTRGISSFASSLQHGPSVHYLGNLPKEFSALYRIYCPCHSPTSAFLSFGAVPHSSCY